MNLKPPEGGWGNYFSTPTITPDRSYNFIHTAKRFEIGGTSNYPGAIALKESVDIINKIGIENSADRIWSLGDKLIDGLSKLDVKLQTPFDRQSRAGIISFSLGDRNRDTACLNALLDHQILVSQRYTSNIGGVRISIHYFNSEDEIDYLLSILENFLKAKNDIH
jgi:selenocysteine lyase/cysteine desulfurase